MQTMEADAENFTPVSSKQSPRSSRKNRQKRINKLSNEQLQLALKKKRECNKKAQKVVEDLINKNIARDSFIEKLKDINQSHYDDIIEERSIINLCGYPLCEEVLEKVPSKQYHISSANNKVYDITERKKFCSNMCFKSSSYLKEQLLTSPLWLRDQEDLQVVRLLPHKKQPDADELI